MIPVTIQKLIESHKKDIQRVEFERTQPQIKVSRAASFFAVLYEKMRNTVDYEEEHLLRKRAVKRIMMRIATLKGGEAPMLADTITKEIILAQYLNDFPVPQVKVNMIATIIAKYQYLVFTYKSIHGRKLNKENAEMLYSLCAFEVERMLMPYNSKDSMVNAQYAFINNKGILTSPDLPKEVEPLQNYIATHRAILKSDDEIIAFHLFYFKFPFWAKPSKEEMRFLAQNLDNSLMEIRKHLNYKVSKKSQKEVVRQSIPFKILDKVIKNNLTKIDEIINDPQALEEQIDMVCHEEYKENKRRLNTTIVRSITYIFITKVILALIIEVPYELAVHKHINYLTLGINIFFPALTMFVVANSFSIPNEKNTHLLKQMIKAILTPSTQDDRNAFTARKGSGSAFRLIFQTIYLVIFFAIFAGIIAALYMLNFNPAGMLIFVIFFSTIFFVSAKLRNTASELRVVESRPSIFAPIIDMFASPILILGKRLSEGASQLNFFTIILDFLIEAPYKNIIKVFEEWNNYVRETREEIV